MTSCVENETDWQLNFDIEDVLRKVAQAVLEMENCPYETCINLILTDNENIRTYNKEYRQIDKVTDVLSFPNLYFEKAGDFCEAEKNEADFFNPDSGELMLGDIVISIDKAKEQAKEYGHSEIREFAFLIAHSMFHLCGYDHMTDAEAADMEKKQEDVLGQLGFVRD